MTTDFGKICRKIRIDNNEVLKDMAQKLGVTTAYLSAVETGKRNVPEEWLDIIKREDKLSMEEYQELLDIVYSLKKTIKIEVEDIPEQDRELMLEFVKNFSLLTDRDKKDIMTVIQKRKSSSASSRWESFLD